MNKNVKEHTTKQLYIRIVHLQKSFKSSLGEYMYLSVPERLAGNVFNYTLNI